MKKQNALVVMTLFAAMGALAQTAPVAPATGGFSLRILAPKAGGKITTSFVKVRYELPNRGAAANTPHFRVQLDGRSPVFTTFTDHTFTGLQPGNHVISVQLVDANHTPIAGAHSEVQFTVVPGEGAPGNASPPR